MGTDEVVEEEEHGNEVVSGGEGCKSLFGFVPGLELLVEALDEVVGDVIAKVHMPPQKCNLTADDGASPPPEWCTASAEMVHGGRERGAPDRHAGNYSGMPLRLRMDSPSIWMV